MSPAKFPLILAVVLLSLNAPSNAQAQVKTDKRLLQKISLDVDAKPVAEVLRELSEKYKLPVDFDASVKDEGIDSALFTLKADAVTLGSVIHLLCEANALLYSMEKGRLSITTVTADADKLIVREHPLGNLGSVIDLQLLAVSLPGLTSGVWMVVDQEGGDVVAIKPQSFAIRQTRKVHAELQELFEQINASLPGRPKAVLAQDRADQMILRKLQTPSQVEAGEKPLSEILDQLLKKNGVSYWIDLTALTDEGIDWTKLSSTVEAKKMTVAARLDAIASEHQLSWRVADELVQLTTAAKGDEQLFCRVYDVRNRPIAIVAEQLVNNKELGLWQINDGEGGALFPIGNLLVVRQTGKAHATIAKQLK